MSLNVVRKYYSKLKKERISELMAEDFVGLAISGIMILIGEKIAAKYFTGDYNAVIIGIVILAGMILSLGLLFIFKTIRANKIASNLHKLHQENERRKDERLITQAQLRVVDAEIALVRLQQDEILEKNQRLWIKHEIKEGQSVLKGQLDVEQEFLDQETRERAEAEFKTIMESFDTLKTEFARLQENLDFKQDEIENGKKATTLISQSTKSKESVAVEDLINPELNNALKSITDDIRATAKRKTKPDPEPDLDKIID